MTKPIFRQAALERLASPEQLDQLMQVTTPRGWLALAALGCLLITAVILSFIWTIPVTVGGKCILTDLSPGYPSGASLDPVGQPAQELQAVVYVSLMDGSKVRPGMDVQISPSTVKREEAGFMLGSVTSVGKYPATAQDMFRALGSNELAQAFSVGGIAPIEVRVKLALDPGVAGGYQWSSPRGAGIAIQSGTLCSADIVVDKRRPIELVLPIRK